MENEKYSAVLETDVCVIGGSSSGMPAAINAADKGANVVILEKTKRLGGTLGVCCGFFGVESPAQKRLGIHDTADDCFKELIQILYWNCDARLVHNWLNDSGESVRWLEGLGMEFDVVEPFQGLRKFCRRTYHTINVEEGSRRPGIVILRGLMRTIEERKDKIDVHYSTRATHLFRDENGAVNAVEAEGPDGTILVKAKAIIIATGSICADNEKIKKYFGRDYSNVQIMARVPHNTGDGIELAEEVGARTGNLSALYIGPHNHGPGCSELTGMLIRRPQNLKLNKAGERFLDEGLWTNSNFGWMESFAIDKQPDMMSWVIFDEKMLNGFVETNEEIGLFEHIAATQECANKAKLKKKLNSDLVDEKFAFYDAADFDGYWMQGLWQEVEKEIAGGRCKKCMNAEEIAEFMGCKHPEVVAESLERYNKFCRQGHDSDFLKAPEHLIELEAPYYVFKGFSGVDTLIGGVHVNYDLKVVDLEMNPIPGLYGAGVCTSGWLNGGYAFYGTELSFCFFSGRNAGKNAADYALCR